MADTKGVLKKDRRPGSSSCLSHFPFSRAGAGALAPTSFPALHGPKRGEPAGGGNRGEWRLVRSTALKYLHRLGSSRVLRRLADRI